MLLKSVNISNYRSIDSSGRVEIDPEVSVLVGQNESGKTAFLEALHKANSIEGRTFDRVEDYPRKWLAKYSERHADRDAKVVELVFELKRSEVTTINADLEFELLSDTVSWTLAIDMNNSKTVGFSVAERTFVAHLLAHSPLSTEIKAKVSNAKSVRGLIEDLRSLDLNDESTDFVKGLDAKYPEPPIGWSGVQYYIWRKHLEPKIPQFLYFDEYKILPAKINIPALRQRVAQKNESDDDRTVLGLLRLAGVEIEDLTESDGYEHAKAQLEGISNSISDQIFKYWRQNQRGGMPELEVQFDIQADPKDAVPFNSGNNLYLRIRSTRHRVSVPFDKRSKGFIWFFSFLVWFDSIKQQIGTDQDLILLLDEPGLSLHALAQDDLLRYIDELAKRHQVVYSTHSPFMVRSDRLHQVRVVEDRDTLGTVVSSNVTDSDEKTLFPLQAALGYSIAQNLFIAKRNLLVEGPSDLLYLRYFSELLASEGRNGLSDEIVIVPTGGLDKVATFVALLGANQLELVVVHDWSRSPEQRLQDLVHRKIIGAKQILNFGMFRDGKKAPPSAPRLDTDVEDFFNDALYLKYFNIAYKRELGGTSLGVRMLPKGDRLVSRISRALAENGLEVRPSGGFNHYRVASAFTSNPPARKDIQDAVLDRFEALFLEINRLFTE